MKPNKPALAAALLSLALAACGGPADAPGAGASAAGAPATGTPAAGPLAEADRAFILGALVLAADAEGRVVNECGDLVTPQFLPAELGGSVGTAILFAIGGGPSIATCYGDGPDLHLFMREATGWREIYSDRGGMLVILPTTTGGVRDLAGGGPGFSFPVYGWDGSRYVYANRDISDAELSGMNATYLP